MKKVAVIGAGIGGIAAALRLRAKGYAVDVYEKNSYAGGKLSEFSMGAYRFDAGPSLFTQPSYVEELFRLFGENPEEHFTYSRLDTICRYFWEDGTILTSTSDLAAFARNIEEHLGEDRQAVLTYLDDSRRLYELTEDLFIKKSFHRLSTFLSPDFLSRLVLVPKLRAFTTLHRENRQYFKNEKTIQLFDRYATYNGSSPYIAPGTLKLISSLEYSYGAYLPDKGMYAITSSLVKLGIRHGIQFHFSASVEKINCDGRKVTGIRVRHTDMPYHIVVSNADVVFTYDRLLQKKGPRRIYRQERSSSALVFNWGIKKTFHQLDLHNIFFSDNYEEEFRQMFVNKTISNDPTVYVFISSKKIKNDAPPGCENWFVLVNAPYLSGQDWDVLTAEVRTNVLQKLSRILKQDIASCIEAEEILDPQAIQLKTSSHLGSLYGTSSNSRTAAFNRHPNFSGTVKNLFFAGGSVHPGGGIPLCLSSARIVANMIPHA